MSSTFQIHQDADKENPIKMQLKESLIENKQQAHNAGGGGGGGKQPLSVIGGVGNANVLRLHSPAAHKVLRDTKNVSKKHNSNKDAAEAKKSNVVPVVEQFKTFSVYEDCNDNQQKTNQQESLERNEKISSQIFIDKENATEKFIKLQQRNKKQTQNDGKSSDILHKDFSLNEDEYIFDTTPMSVSDVLSPMSVDRSQLSISAMLSDSTSNKSAENKKDKEANEECKSESSQLKAKEQIPRNDRQRFFEVVEYQRSILEYFRESEKKHRPKPHYMRRQSDITHAMRTILVDWLVEVCEEYNLDTETLYLSVSYIDRFLSQMSVVRNKLQLVGTAAMYIASKYEEIYPPDVGEFVFITDDTYVKPQVLRMEQIILKILAFDLCTPTGYVFINTYAVLCDIPDKVKFLAQYICELSLLDADPYLRFYPSIISAASVALAFYVLGHPIWSSELEEITTYRLEDLKEVFLHLVKSHNKATTMDQQAIQDKYKAEKYLKVSTITPLEINETRLDQIILDYNAEMEKQKNSKNGITPKEKLQLFKF